MTTPVVRIKASSPDLQAGLDRIRADLGVPLAFPHDADQAAIVAAKTIPFPRTEPIDARDLELEIPAPRWTQFLQVRRIEALPISFTIP